VQDSLVLLKSKFKNKVIIFPIIIWITKVRILESHLVICYFAKNVLRTSAVLTDNYFDLDHSEVEE